MQKYQDSVLQAPLSTPIVGASVQVNIFGGGAATIYSNNGVTVAPNPTLTDGNGRFAFYAADGRYSLVVSKAGFTTQTIADVLLEDPATSPSDTLLFSQSPAAPAGTVSAKLQQIISVKDAPFNALGDGVTDDTAAIQAAYGTGKSVFHPPGTYLISAPLVPSSNADYFGAGTSSVILTATTNISMFSAASKTNIHVYGLHFKQTAAGANANLGAVAFDTCTHCNVTECEFEGMQWAGVWLNNSTHCLVRGNYFHNFLGTVQDQADVCVYRVSSFNVICDNFMYGGGWHGCLVQDPGSSLFPLKNVVKGNRVGAHTAYGIVVYNIDAGDSFTTVEGNFIEGVTGVNPSGSGGAGIYVQNSGGTIVANNTIRNCCISTSNETLTPAGIGIVNISGMSPVTVVGNTVVDMNYKNGIEVATSSTDVAIVGNTVRFSSTATASRGIYINAASNVLVDGNAVKIDTAIAASTGIYVFANGTNLTNITVSNNQVQGCTSRSIRFQILAAETITGIVVNGNILSGGSSACINLDIANVTGAQVTGNTAIATTAAAFTLTTTTQARIANNYLTSTGTQAFQSAGTCTGSYFDKTNYWNGTMGNAGTGCIVEQLASAVPGAGNAAVGDRIEQSVPVVGNPKGWRCTVAGSPGTWVSEGNL